MNDNNLKIVKIIIISFIILGLGLAGYFYYSYQQDLKKINSIKIPERN
jgi:hypothetical protein